MKKSLPTTIGTCIILIISFGSGICALSILYDYWGFWALFLGLLLYPVTIFFIPLYMLFVYVKWQLLVFTYGGFLLGGFIFSIDDDDSD